MSSTFVQLIVFAFSDKSAFVFNPILLIIFKFNIPANWYGYARIILFYRNGIHLLWGKWAAANQVILVKSNKTIQ